MAKFTMDEFNAALGAQAEHIERVLPPWAHAARFLDMATRHVQGKGKLHLCTLSSLITEICVAAKYGYDLGYDAMLVGFKGQGKLIPHYQGMCKYLEGTGKVRKCMAEPVYGNDMFEMDLGDFRKPITHKPALKNRGPVIGAYGAIVMRDNTWHVHWMPAEDIEKARPRSMDEEQDVWVRAPIEMYRKTVLKNTMKYCQIAPAREMVAQIDETESFVPADLERVQDATNSMFVPAPERAAPPANGMTPPPAPTDAEIRTALWRTAYAIMGELDLDPEHLRADLRFRHDVDSCADLSLDALKSMVAVLKNPAQHAALTRRYGKTPAPQPPPPKTGAETVPLEQLDGAALDAALKEAIAGLEPYALAGERQAKNHLDMLTKYRDARLQGGTPSLDYVNRELSAALDWLEAHKPTVAA